MGISPRQILVVEDDRKTADLVSLYLRHAGHRVDVVHDGTAGLTRAREGNYDLLVLDVMLPGVDGLEICREMTRNGSGGVILLTARTLEDQRVGGFESGADDYVTKPFSPRELVARAEAVLRRVPSTDETVIERGALRIDLSRRTVEAGGTRLDLTPSEFELLLCLARRPGQVFDRGQLLARLPGRAGFPMDRTIDVHVRNLRRKLDAAAGAADWIETVFGVGYRFAERST